mgnify:CR=1 FL=1
MDNALTIREIQLEGEIFTIARADLPITTVVRLSRLGGITEETQIRSICERYGSLDNIRKRGNGVYDVFYKVKELPNIPNILDRYFLTLGITRSYTLLYYILFWRIYADFVTYVFT